MLSHYTFNWPGSFCRFKKKSRIWSSNSRDKSQYTCIQLLKLILYVCVIHQVSWTYANCESRTRHHFLSKINISLLFNKFKFIYVSSISFSVLSAYSHSFIRQKSQTLFSLSCMYNLMLIHKISRKFLIVHLHFLLFTRNLWISQVICIIDATLMHEKILAEFN